MADLTTYADLQTAILQWTNRFDLSDRTADFIVMAEAALNRELRVRDMLYRVYYKSDTNFPEFVVMPDDFLETYTFIINPQGQPPEQALEYLGQKDAQSVKAHQMTAPTRYYSITDGVFELIPAPTTPMDIKLTYYARLPPLGASTTGRNWLSLKSPDLYLTSAICEAAPYLNDDGRIQYWTARRAKALEDINVESERSMRPRTQLVARAKALDGLIPTTVWPW